MPRINLRLPEIFGPKLTWKKEITPIWAGALGFQIPKHFKIRDHQIFLEM